MMHPERRTKIWRKHATPPTRMLARGIFFWQLLGIASVSFSTANPQFFSTQLGFIGESRFYFPGALSEQGLIGGYYRINEYPQFPVDVAVTWNSAGSPSILPVSGEYSAAVVNGFQPDGTPLGLVARPVGVPMPGIPVPGYWTQTDFLAQPLIGLGGGFVAGNGIVVVGQSFVPAQTPAGYAVKATIWDESGPRLITGLNDEHDPNMLGINSAGVYVGTEHWAVNGQSRNQSFIGRNGSATLLDFPGFSNMVAYEINDSGWFAGRWQPEFGRFNGFVARYDLDTGESEIHDLGVFPGYTDTWGYAINDDDTIVGAAFSLVTGDFDKALIWPNGSLVPQDLNLMVDIPGATLIDAYRINNAGQILAEARLDSGGFAYYRLDPIPEPIAGAMIGAALFVARSRTRVAGN